MEINFSNHLKKILYIAQKAFNRHEGLIQETGSTNIKGDETIEMDVKIEKLLLDYLRKTKLPIRVFSEEIGLIDLQLNPEYMVVFDPLDGSSNYQFGQNLLPYGLLISVYNSVNPSLGNIITSGMYEATSQRGFIYDGISTRNLRGEPVSLLKRWKINAKTSTYFDFYYKEAVQKFGTLAQKVHLRWGGSNISSLLYVLSQIGAVMGSARMRAEEIGTVVSLITGAGGLAVDLSGKNILEESLEVDKVYPFIAGNEEVVKYLIKELNK